MTSVHRSHRAVCNSDIKNSKRGVAQRREIVIGRRHRVPARRPINGARAALRCVSCTQRPSIREPLGLVPGTALVGPEDHVTEVVRAVPARSLRRETCKKYEA